jgi:hypothetical protein
VTGVIGVIDVTEVASAARGQQAADNVGTCGGI